MKRSLSCESQRPTAMSSQPSSDLSCCNLVARGTLSACSRWSERGQRPVFNAQCLASLDVDTLAASETGLQSTDSDTGPHCRIEPASTGGHLHLKLPVLQFLRAFTNQPENLTTTSGSSRNATKRDQSGHCSAVRQGASGGRLLKTGSARHSTAGCQCTAQHWWLPSHYKWWQAYVITALH